MRTLLAASALMLAFAAPAAAQMTDMDASDPSVYDGAGAPASDNPVLLDETTTQSIAPAADNMPGMRRDDSSPLREDVDEGENRAVGGRAN